MSELSQAAKKAKEWTRRRDMLIVQARAEGHALRAIATEAGLTHPAVAKILKRDA